MVLGLSHITLLVRDLERTSVFLNRIFDAKEVYSSGDLTFSLSREKFFLINDLWLCIMEGELLAERSYNHIAFQIRDEEIDSYIIKSVGAEIKLGRSRVCGEGRSIYFYDFDGHLFELHAGNLADRLIRYKKSDNKT